MTRKRGEVWREERGVKKRKVMRCFPLPKRYVSIQSPASHQMPEWPRLGKSPTDSMIVRADFLGRWKSKKRDHRHQFDNGGLETGLLPFRRQDNNQNDKSCKNLVSVTNSQLWGGAFRKIGETHCEMFLYHRV